MKLEYISADWLKREIRKILVEHLDSSYRAFFFGSRVKGDNFERADIDLGVEGPGPIPPALKLAIQEELDRLPILYKIDLVDFRRVTPAFRREALRYREPI